MVSIVSMHCTSVTDIIEDEKTDSNHRTAVRYTLYRPSTVIRYKMRPTRMPRCKGELSTCMYKG